MPKSIEILIYEAMNELEFAAIYEILTAVEIVPPGGHVPQKAFHVETVADKIAPIGTSHGLRLAPHKGIAASVGADILIIPGGPGARRPTVAPSIISWLTGSIGSSDLISAASTGVYILGKAGLINNRRVTTHSSMTDDLHRLYPRADIVTGQRVVVDGRNLMTSAGGSAAIDLALAIVNRFNGPQTAQSAANRIEYGGFTP